MTEIHRLGTTLLSAADGASGNQRNLNIIFVHGLRGHPRATWSHLLPTTITGRYEDTAARINEHKSFKSFFGLRKSKKEEQNNQGQTRTSIPADIFWPEEYLVPDLPQARIWTYGYNADVIGGLFKANSENSVSQHGRDLAVHLDREIDNETLEVNGEVLDNIHEEFKTVLAKYAIKVHSFQESKGISGMKGLDNKVVGNFSSKLDLARGQETVESIDANHMEMARCSTRRDSRYRQICGVLKQFIRTEMSNRETNLVNTTSPVEYLQPPPSLVPYSPQSNSSSSFTPKASTGEKTLSADTEKLPSNGLSTSPSKILHAAIKRKGVKGVKSALSKGADPNCKAEDGITTPLNVAALHGLLKIAQLLLDAGANVNGVDFEGTPPLRLAAQVGATDVVQLLIERGANLDQAPYAWQDSPLIVAAAKDHIEVVRLLLTAGTNSRAQQSNGWSCLHFALWNKNKEMAALVLEYRPDVNASTRWGLRPLHLASTSGFVDICSQLVNLGAELDATDSDGLTALGAAVQAAELEIVKMLVTRGARTDIGGLDGRSLIATALTFEYESVYQYLKDQTVLATKGD